MLDCAFAATVIYACTALAVFIVGYAFFLLGFGSFVLGYTTTGLAVFYASFIPGHAFVFIGCVFSGAGVVFRLRCSALR